MQEVLTNRNGQIVLYPTANPLPGLSPNATVGEPGLAQTLADADAQFTKKLSVCPGSSGGRQITAKTDFVNLSTKWMTDFVSSFSFGIRTGLYPNHRGMLMWVTSRTFSESLETRSRIDSLYWPVLMQELYEQFTSTSQFTCRNERGFGGWAHGSAEEITKVRGCSPTCSFKSTCICSTDFADSYKQWMGYHLMVVRVFPRYTAC